MTTDPHDGSIYVVGATLTRLDGYDFLTIKYNASGDTVWTAKFNGTANDDDYAIAVALDDSGNVFVTGSTTGKDSSYDYATIKYSSAGVQRWVETYSGAQASEDNPAALVIDNDGNVIVTGSSFGPDSSYDFVTIKYSSSGGLIWLERYASSDESDDYPVDILADGSGNFYIAGNSQDQVGDSRGVVVSCTSAGNENLLITYDGGGNSYEATDALLDAQGSIYLGGGIETDLDGFDYGTLKYSSSGVQDWVETYDDPSGNDDEVAGMALDGTGNLIVTGASGDSDGTDDFYTVKYDSNGNTLWSRRFSNPNSDDDPYFITLDAAGSVYIAGSSSPSGGDYENILLKYDGWGRTISTSYFEGANGSYNYPAGLVLTPAGNAVMTGSSNIDANSQAYTEAYSQPAFLEVVKQPLVFTNGSVGCSVDSLVTVLNLGAAQTIITSATSSDSSFSVSPSTAVVPALTAVQFSVAYSPLNAGATSGYVLFHSGAFNGVDSLEVNGTGSGPGEAINVSTSLATGWELISLPVQTGCPAILPGLFAYSSGYHSTDTLADGEGYWKKLSDPVLTFTGYAESTDTITLPAGWSLVGGLTYAVYIGNIQTVPANANGNFYGYSGGYLVADTLKPVRGYWVKMSEAGRMILTAIDASNSK
jgi:hypothetical protein